jgi:hypothetical protein
MNAHEDDALSDVARVVLKAREADAYTRLVVSAEPSGDANLRRRLDALNTDSVLARPVVSRPDAEAVVAGLWLWHDFLDASHTISQSIATPTGSFWHAIMHRREGDFSNAKYWYARCRNHPALADVSARVGEPWEPNRFVDLVEQVQDEPGDPQHARAVELQRIEWKALFDHCLRAAAGAAAP